jgi:hypothetical protein
MISEKDLWDFAVDKAIEIWENRAKGEDDSRDCPLCAVAGLLVPLGTENCEICVLKNCYTTPFGEYSHTYEPDKEMQASKEMVNMLKALKSGNTELFNKYLNYWDSKNEVRLW